MNGSIQLLQQPDEHDGAAATFRRVKQQLGEARENVEIFMYVWRSDEVGNEIGRAVLAAADRGVKVRIIKDTGAFLFERIEMNRKSFFNRDIPAWKKAVYAILTPTFPDTHVEDSFDHEVGNAVMAHPNVSLEWVNKTHTKYYLFDEETMLTGSINLEDRHRGYFDYMVALEGREHVARLRSRMAGESAPDTERAVEFYLNQHEADGSSRFEIRPRFLELIGNARESIDVEMAYLGDEAITAAIVGAANRGVRVQFLFSPEANIGNEINYHTMRQIMLTCPAEVYFTPKMIHSKMMRFDGEIVAMGSANLSVFSMQKSEEVNLEFREAEIIRSFGRVFEGRLRRSQRVEDPGELSGYSQIKAHLQQWHQKLNPN